MRTTQKAIKAFPAEDITRADFETINAILRKGNKTSVAHSIGVYGVNGYVFEIGGKLYKITSRSTALFQCL